MFLLYHFSVCALEQITSNTSQILGQECLWHQLFLRIYFGIFYVNEM